MAEFRERIEATAERMLSDSDDFMNAVRPSGVADWVPVLRQIDAEKIDEDRAIRSVGPVDLVVTSPPYPGIHMLYHRWQVDGRKETDAPYWIAACQDGAGAAYYNFASRKSLTHDRYFQKAHRSFSAVRRTMRTGAVLAQLIAFSDPDTQLARYLEVMQGAGFHELDQAGQGRTWRSVPGRKWHANLKGSLPSAREVFLLHEAV